LSLKLFFFCHSRNNSRTTNTLKNQYSCLFISGTDVVFQSNAWPGTRCYVNQKLLAITRTTKHGFIPKTKQKLL